MVCEYSFNIVGMRDVICLSNESMSSSLFRKGPSGTTGLWDEEDNFRPELKDLKENIGEYLDKALAAIEREAKIALSEKTETVIELTDLRTAKTDSFDLTLTPTRKEFDFLVGNLIEQTMDIRVSALAMAYRKIGITASDTSQVPLMGWWTGQGARVARKIRMETGHDSHPGT